MTTPVGEEDFGSFAEQIIEPIRFTKLINYINDAIQTLFEDPAGSIQETQLEKDTHSLSPVKICTNFSTDVSPAVLFVLKEVLEQEIKENNSNGMLC